MPTPSSVVPNFSADASAANPIVVLPPVTPATASAPPTKVSLKRNRTDVAKVRSTAKPEKSYEVIPRDTVEVWDVPFDRLDMRQSVDAVQRLIERGKPSYVVTANINYCMLHDQDEQVRQITGDADLILADGQPIVLRSRLTPKPLPARVAGSEMILHLCKRAADNGWRVYFLGGVEGVAHGCAEKLKQMYPRLQIAGTQCPPFRTPTTDEHAEQLRQIRDADTDLLFVAFGQPKGEKWIHENYQSLGVPVTIQLGASFDFIAGTATRAPVFFQRTGMEWAYRMMTDPRRLIPRYAANASYLIKALTRSKPRKTRDSNLHGSNRTSGWLTVTTINLSRLIAVATTHFADSD